jgi:hypothetical protein
LAISGEVGGSSPSGCSNEKVKMIKPYKNREEFEALLKERAKEFISTFDVQSLNLSHKVDIHIHVADGVIDFITYNPRTKEWSSKYTYNDIEYLVSIN